MISSHFVHTRTGSFQSRSGTGRLFGEHFSQTPSPQLRLKKKKPMRVRLNSKRSLPMMQSICCRIESSVTYYTCFAFTVWFPIARSSTFYD